MRMCVLTLWLGLACAASAQEHKISVQSFVNPEYPPIARAAHAEGDVRLRMKLDAQGIVNSVEVVSGHPMFVQSAIKAIKNWRFHCDDCGFGQEFDHELTVSFVLDKSTYVYNPDPCNHPTSPSWRLVLDLPNRITLKSGFVDACNCSERITPKGFHGKRPPHCEGGPPLFDPSPRPPIH